MKNVKAILLILSCALLIAVTGFLGMGMLVVNIDKENKARDAKSRYLLPAESGLNSLSLSAIGPSLFDWQAANADCRCRITAITAQNASRDASAMERIWFAKIEPADPTPLQEFVVGKLEPDAKKIRAEKGFDAMVDQLAAQLRPGAKVVAAHQFSNLGLATPDTVAIIFEHPAGAPVASSPVLPSP